MKIDNSAEYTSIRKKDLYKGVSFIGSLGVWYTIIGLIGIIIFLGVFLLINNLYHNNWKIIQAEVLEDPKCYTHTSKGEDDEITTIKCNYEVSYAINNIEYKGTLLQKDSLNLIHIDAKKYLNIEYNPLNPREIDTIFPKKILNIIIGSILSILIIITIFLIIYRDNNVVKGLTTINMLRDITTTRK
jgi:hypothetical protein